MKKQLEIKPWTIYLWRNGDKMEGASPVVTRDGIKQIYCHGWEIEKCPEDEGFKNDDKVDAWRAKVKVKNLLNNTLNVLNWYGKKVLDNNGNIDTEKLKIHEVGTALRLVKQNQIIKEGNKKLPKDKQTEELIMDDLYPIKKFPQKEITIQKALDYGFIGNKIQNKFIDKHK